MDVAQFAIQFEHHIRIDMFERERSFRKPLRFPILQKLSQCDQSGIVLACKQIFVKLFEGGVCFLGQHPWRFFRGFFVFVAFNAQNVCGFVP